MGVLFVDFFPKVELYYYHTINYVVTITYVLLFYIIIFFIYAYRLIDRNVTRYCPIPYTHIYSIVDVDIFSFFLFKMSSYFSPS